jgi:hypothetical protein
MLPGKGAGLGGKGDGRCSTEGIDVVGSLATATADDALDVWKSTGIQRLTKDITPQPIDSDNDEAAWRVRFTFVAKMTLHPLVSYS